jgi:hypothetical protein
MKIKLYEHRARGCDCRVVPCDCAVTADSVIKNRLLVLNLPEPQARALAQEYFDCPSGQRSVHQDTLLELGI